MRAKESKDKTARRKGYWILFHYEDCVLCGKELFSYRERVYDRPKPVNAAERYELKENACGHHFC